jgi:hypothetical protein
MNRYAWSAALPIAVVVLTGLVAASPALAWRDNYVHSPTGNLVCHYNGYGRISCGRLNDGLTLSVDRYGARRLANGTVYRWRSGHALPYGTSARSFDSGPRVTIRSTASGLTVRVGGHGFFINRVRSYKW